jgi:hypothetical protein
MINPELMKLLETNDVLDVLKDSVTYQMQKIHGVEKTSEGREWHREIPQIAREKFDNYKTDYEQLFSILKLGQEEIKNEMNKGYYYWRLLHSACNTYRNDLIEYDHQLNEEFNLEETNAISDNKILNECVGILDQHVVEK